VLTRVFEAKSCFVVPGGMSNDKMVFPGRGEAGAKERVVALEFLLSNLFGQC
jgi:hypothetical protein